MYYKILSGSGISHFQDFQWPLPKNGEPGEWLPPVEGELEICGNGYHVVTREHIIDWLDAECIFPVEVQGDILERGSKIAVRQARLLPALTTWNATTQRLFACDCAERALPLFEKQYPEDNRPRQAIQTARDYAEGESSIRQLNAARDAARDAVGAAERAAAWAAERAAAWAAAGEAARHWQANRLFYYLNGNVTQ